MREELLTVVKAPVEIVKFIGARLLGGGWDALPRGEEKPAVPPVRAKLTYYDTDEHIDTPSSKTSYDEARPLG